MHLHCLVPAILKAVLSINVKTDNHSSVLFLDAVLLFSKTGKLHILKNTSFGTTQLSSSEIVFLSCFPCLERCLLTCAQSMTYKLKLHNSKSIANYCTN